MIVLVRSLKNWVRGAGSSSGFQSTSRSSWIFSKRLGGLSAAPRANGGDLGVVLTGAERANEAEDRFQAWRDLKEVLAQAWPIAPLPQQVQVRFTFERWF